MNELTIKVFDKNKIDEYKKYEKLVIEFGDPDKAYCDFSKFSELREIEIKSWENVKCCCGMFRDCAKLQSVKLPGSWENVTDCSEMFSSCKNLKSITLPVSWGNVTDCYEMFSGCENLESITLPKSWGNVPNYCKMFDGCKNLQSNTSTNSWVYTNADVNNFPEDWGWKNVKVVNDTAHTINDTFN